MNFSYDGTLETCFMLFVCFLNSLFKRLGNADIVFNTKNRKCL